MLHTKNTKHVSNCNVNIAASFFIGEEIEGEYRYIAPESAATTTVFR